MPTKYKVGDKSRVIEGNKEFKEGDILELKEDDGSDFPFWWCERTNEDYPMFDKELEPYKEEETMFKTGDRIRNKDGKAFSNGMKEVTVDYAETPSYSSDSLVWIEETGTNTPSSKVELVDTSRFSKTVTTTELKTFSGNIAGRRFRVEPSRKVSEGVYINNRDTHDHYSKEQLKELIKALTEIEELL